MTNVYGTPEKVSLRAKLFGLGVETLQKEGWTVERIVGAGKSSVRRITKEARSLVVSIRTSQDTWIAFPRTTDDKSWVTLSEVDAVVAVSVDDRDAPSFAQVHLIDGDDLRDRFDRAYAARVKAGRSIPIGRGVWVSLYEQEASNPVTLVGAGAGLANPALARIPLKEDNENLDADDEAVPSSADDDFLTIAEAKRRLAITLDVDPSSIKISIEV